MSQKRPLLTNNKFALLSAREKHFTFLKDEEQVQRFIEDGSIGDGDVVVALTEENVRVATRKNYIELK